MTKEEIKMIQERIEASTLSEDTKWKLRQVLRSTICDCGHTLVRDGKLIVIGTLEGKEATEKEINESGIATATAEIVNKCPK